jgi:hypothetical protein
MRRYVSCWSFLLVLLALAACAGPGGSTATTTPTPTLAVTPTPSPTPTPTPPPPAGFVFYTSQDHTYLLAYPTGWLILSANGQTQFTGVGQLFEVSETGGAAQANPAQSVNSFCQSKQAGVAPDPVQTTTVNLAGQSWTRANCDAGAQGPAIQWVVEVAIYKGISYQIDYTSPIVEFKRDNSQYYTPMERSFRFLR